MTKPNPFGGGPKKAAKKAPAAQTKRRAAEEEDEDDTTDLDEDSVAASDVDESDPFADPGGGSSDYKFNEFLDELLLINPIEEDEMVTSVSKGQLQPFIRTDIVRLENGNELVQDVLVFQTACIRSLRKVMRGPNQWTIARLEMGEARGGNNAPYILTPATAEEKKLAITVAKELKLKLVRKQAA